MHQYLNQVEFVRILVLDQASMNSVLAILIILPGEPMKKLSLIVILAFFAFSLSVSADEKCAAECNAQCNGTGAGFMGCFNSCLNGCTPEPTGNPQVDKANLCANKCAGQGANFASCMKSCKST
jgi:hypothetical protein